MSWTIGEWQQKTENDRKEVEKKDEADWDPR